MTYDIAVWVPSRPGRPSDREATADFERRVEASEERYLARRPPAPQLARVADLLEARFDGPEPPWEELRGELDGDSLYVTIGGLGGHEGPEVERYLSQIAADVGVVVYSPLGESVVAAPLT
ncbi:hypothetical protein GCM10011519_07760 [Marmoricola endophyticus]|uniref:Uncharacterized protein n=1 Tax=Marmoricola endophyticus TaxID=2040280 RepID=A0A917EZZ4_9ACTN|nr:hypothetical protein [Marmoricola endophyticus]GGF36666.1 hypothetical protein GCM10011519_07760 [Marmoricola endophyticus]